MGVTQARSCFTKQGKEENIAQPKTKYETCATARFLKEKRSIFKNYTKGSLGCQPAGHGASPRLLSVPDGDGSPMRLALSSVCAQDHGIRFFLPQRCHSRNTAWEADACLFLLCNWLERGSGQSFILQSLFPEESLSPNGGAGPGPRAWTTVLIYSSRSCKTFWITMQFFSSLPWDAACPDLFLE